MGLAAKKALVSLVLDEEETSPEPTDDNFNQTILLLKADGSEGQGNTADLGNPSYKAFQDNSTNSYDVIVNGEAYGNDFSPYYYANGYWSNYFRGSTGDYIALPASADFDLDTGNFTIEFWAYVMNDITSDTANQMAISATHVTGRYINFRDGSTHGRMQITVGGQDYNINLNSNPKGAWHHFAIVRKNSTTVELFYDGASMGTITVGASEDFDLSNGGSNECRIGAWYNGGYPFYGYLSNFRIVKGTALYTSNFTPSSSPFTTTSQSATASEVTLLTCQSNRIIDNGTNTHSLTVGNVPTVSTNTPFTQSKTDNVGSGYFDGNGDVIYVEETDSNFTYGTGDYEFSCWVYRTVTGAQQTLFGRDSTGNTNVPYIYITSGNKFAVYYGSVIAASTVNVPSNAWCHLVASRVSGTLKLFQDGVEVASVSNTTDLIASTKIAIGNQHTGGTTNAFTGFISDARVRKGSGVTSVTVPTTSLTAETGTELLTCQYSGAVRNLGFLDDSRYNHLMTRTGDVSMGTFSPFSAEDGYWSVACNTAGNISLGSRVFSNLSGDKSWTIEGWLYYPDPGNAYTNLISAYTIGQVTSTAIILRGSGSTYEPSSISLQTYHGGSGGANITWLSAGSNSIPHNQWFHFAFVRDSSNGNGYCFINGVLETTVSFSATAFRDVDNAMNGGSNIASHNMYISNFRIVDGTAVYTSAFTPTTAPLTAITNTTFLMGQSNRFIDNSSSPVTITPNSDGAKIESFSPFAPSRSYSKDAVGGSGLFDGSGTYLSTSYKNDFAVSAPFTFEAWIYPRSISSGENNIVATELDGGSNGGVVLGIKGSGTNIYLATQAAGYTVDIGSQTIKTYEWSHIAAVVNGTGSNETDIYLNGTRVGQGTYNSTFSGNYATFIGQDGRGNGYFNGYIFNPRISTSARYSGASFTHLTAPISSDNNTLFLSKFDNAGIFDHAMKNNLELEGDNRVRTNIKKFGTGSIYFDGNDALQYDSGNALAFRAGPFTVEFFVYFIGHANAGGPNVRASLVRGIGISSGHFVIQRYDGDWRVGTEPSPQIIVTQNANSETWYHVALTRDSSQDLRLFIDGTQAGSTVQLTQDFSENDFYFGNLYRTGGSTRALTGCLDEIRFTSGVARYTSNFTAPTQTFPNK